MHSPEAHVNWWSAQPATAAISLNRFKFGSWRLLYEETQQPSEPSSRILQQVNRENHRPYFYHPCDVTACEEAEMQTATTSTEIMRLVPRWLFISLNQQHADRRRRVHEATINVSCRIHSNIGSKNKAKRWFCESYFSAHTLRRICYFSVCPTHM